MVAPDNIAVALLFDPILNHAAPVALAARDIKSVHATRGRAMIVYQAGARVAIEQGADDAARVCDVAVRARYASGGCRSSLFQGRGCGLGGVGAGGLRRGCTGNLGLDLACQCCDPLADLSPGLAIEFAQALAEIIPFGAGQDRCGSQATAAVIAAFVAWPRRLLLCDRRDSVLDLLVDLIQIRRPGAVSI